jgi:hypothetical protein
MATTQSGYSVLPDYSDPQLISNPAVPGTNGAVKVYGGLRTGAPAVVLLYVLGRFHKEIDPLKQQNGVWGYEPRTIVGGDGSTWSNHAGGVAVDANAARHPRGASTFSGWQIDAARRIVADLSGVVDWGGEWVGATKDEMHFQLHGDIAGTGRVEQAAAAIRANTLPHVPAELAGHAPIPSNHLVHPDPVVKPVPPDHAPAFPLTAGFYYGPLEGPAESISGSAATDTAAMRHGLAVWQARMQKTGAHLTVDGFYGPQTAGVARSLQTRKHLVVDGLIGPKTWRAAWA